MTHPSSLVPLLVVQGATAAIDFYVRALGAQVIARYEHGPERHLSHADLGLGSAVFSLTEELPGWNSDAPPTLRGSPVVLQLGVQDVDASLLSLERAGADILFPAQELLGERMARVRDPFGHLWILRQTLHPLSTEEIQRQRDELFQRFAQLEPPHPRPAPQQSSTLRGTAPQAQARIHLVLGPVGAGKSTYASQLSAEAQAVRFNLDQWMVALFSPDRPEVDVIDWYVERAARATDQIWRVAQGVLQTSTDVVLELGLIRRQQRASFYEQIAQTAWPLTIYVLDAERDLRRRRVEQRNRTRGPTFCMQVPDAIFERASDLWEPLEPAECAGRDVRFLRTDR